MRLNWKAFFVLALVLWLVASCGPSAAPASPTAASGTAAAPAAAPAAPTAAPRPSGKLTIVSGNWGVEGFDATAGLTNASNRLLRLIYDPLVGQTDDGQDSTETGVAQKWEMSPDGKTWTFYVRKGIKFHNGDDLTAEDVKFTIEYLMRADSKSNYVGELKNASPKIEVVDPYTVRLVLKDPNIFLPSLLTDSDWLLGYIMPKKYIEEKGVEAFRKAPVGSGPYKLAEWTPGNRVVLEAVPNHWRVGTPKYQNVVFQIVEEEGTRIAMLKAGEADIAQIKREAAKEMKAAGFRLGVKEGDLIADIHLWKWEPPLNNKLVREALAISMNRQEMLDQIFQGFGKLEGTAPAGRSSLGFEHRPGYPYDPERAKQLLTQAGYPGGKGLKLVLWSMTYSFPEGPDMMQALAGYWSKLGIEAEVRPTDFATLRPLLTSKKAPPGTIMPMGHPTGRRDSLVNINSQEGEGDASVSNDPVLNDMIKKARVEVDLKTKEKLYHGLSQYLYDNFYHPTIAEVSVVWAAGKQIPEDWNLGLRVFDVNVEDLARRK